MKDEERELAALQATPRVFWLVFFFLLVDLLFEFEFSVRFDLEFIFGGRFSIQLNYSDIFGWDVCLFVFVRVVCVMK